MDLEELSRKLAEGLDSLKRTSFSDKDYKGPKRNYLF
jgi:hypothetical protein